MMNPVNALLSGAFTVGAVYLVHTKEYAGAVGLALLTLIVLTDAICDAIKQSKK